MEQILQPKTLSNFGMANASVDVAILQFKGHMCQSSRLILETGACNKKKKKKKKRPNLGFP